MIEIVALRPEHRAEVGAIFSATQLLGRPLPFALDGADRYERFALDWYFTDGIADGAVAVTAAGAVVGYCLVCCAPEQHRRWVTRATVHLTAGLTGDLVRGRIGRRSRRFYRGRLRDAARLGVSRQATADAAHAHVNLLPSLRDGSVARRLRDHVDERCRLVGIDARYGEVNARGSQRVAGLSRVGGAVIARHRNHTFSALLGEPVTRLTMLRQVPPAVTGRLRCAQPPATAGMIDTVAPSGTGVSSPWR